MRQKIQKYDADLKMSSAEAEVAKLAQSFDFNVTTDFGQLEQVIQGKIDTNRAKCVWPPIFQARAWLLSRLRTRWKKLWPRTR